MNGHAITKGLTHCYLPQSIIYMGFPCGVAPSVGLSACVMLGIHHDSILSTRSTALISLGTLCLPTTPPPTKATSQLFTSSAFREWNFPLGRVCDGQEQGSRTQVFNFCVISSMGSFDGNWVLALGRKGLPNSRAIVIYPHISPRFFYGRVLHLDLICLAFAFVCVICEVRI